MNSTAIVTGTDGSPSAIFAAQHAARLARAQRAALHLVAAYRPEDDEGPRKARVALEQTTAAIAPEPGLTLHSHRVAGDAASALVTHARACDATLIVVGNRGTDSLVPWRRSVADSIERRAERPVVVVDTEPYWHATVPKRAPRVPRHVKVLLACMLAVFMSLLDVTIVNVAFPDMERDFRGTPVSDLSWVLNAYNVVLAATLVLAGRLADRRGRRAVFYSSLYLFVLGSALCAAAPNADLLVAARILQAVGAAGMIPTSLGLLLPEFPAEKRAHAVSLWAAAGAVAAGTGPSLGGVLVQEGGWRWAFLINLIMALGFIPARKVLVERRSVDADTSSDNVGGLLVLLAVGLTALGIVKAPEWGWTGTSTLWCWAGATVCTAALATHTRRHPSPILEPALLAIRSFRIAAATQLVYSAGFYALLLANVLFLNGIWHYSVLHAGVAITPGPIAGAIGAAVAGRIVERTGPRVLVVFGAVGTAAAMELYRVLPGRTPNYAVEWLPCQILSGLSAGVVFAALSTASVMDLPENRIATGTALASCLRQIGAVLGVATLIAVLGPSSATALDSAFHDAYGLIGLAAVTAAVCATRLPRRITAVIGEAAAIEPRPVRDVAGLTTHETVLHGMRVVYRTAGEKTASPIVLVHGLLDSGATWRRLAPILAMQHYVIVPDLPGHGDTDGRPGADYSISGHARFVRDLLDQLGFERSDVVGQSIGAAVAIAYTLNWPERVNTLSVISAGGIGREVSGLLRFAARPGSVYVMRILGSRPVVSTVRTLGWLLRTAGVRGAARAARDLASVFTRLADASQRAAFVETIRAGVDHRGQRATALPELATSKVPLLIVWGEADRIIPAAHAELVQAVRPDAQVVVLKGVGHSAHQLQPALVAEQIFARTARRPRPYVVAAQPAAA